MTKLPILFLLTLVIGCQMKEEQKSHVNTQVTKIDSIFTSLPDFSGVVLFADKGTPLYHKAFGKRSFETNTSLELNDIFELASVSKQFTSMTIMLLKQDGKLNYDDPIDKYLPGITYQGITIRHLLTHTSGLPDYYEVMDQYWDKNKVATNSDIFEYLKKYNPPKHFEPGVKYEYSNTGYVFLASITEAVSGKDFVEFCRERIFELLGMTSTAIRSNDEKNKLSNLAYGHIYLDDKKRFVRADSFPSSNYTIWLGGRKGPGRVSSTATDLLKWDQTLYTNQIVSQETLKDAFTPAKLNDGTASNYGFGWDIIPTSSAGRVVWHNGDNPGYKTIIVRYLDAKKTLIILNNNYHPQFEEARQAIDEMVAELFVKA
jgi:CubicO group peptidase (beta-lactamase class C family)